MTNRLVKYKPNQYIKKCPMCGNNTEFTICSDYCSEDCCEIWVECQCRYDPTAGHGNRLEDVWGGVDDDNCLDAIKFSWNENI